jgi:hypothetical protein
MNFTGRRLRLQVFSGKGPLEGAAEQTAVVPTPLQICARKSRRLPRSRWESPLLRPRFHRESISLHFFVIADPTRHRFQAQFFFGAAVGGTSAAPLASRELEPVNQRLDATGVASWAPPPRSKYCLRLKYPFQRSLERESTYRLPTTTDMLQPPPWTPSMRSCRAGQTLVSLCI